MLLPKTSVGIQGISTHGSVCFCSKWALSTDMVEFVPVSEKEERDEMEKVDERESRRSLLSEDFRRFLFLSEFERDNFAAAFLA